jgi:hypothetical protein
VTWSEERLATMRAGFFDALDDPQHPVWDRLLDGLYGRTVGIVDVMHRHPFGHQCGVCRAWRRQNPELAAIEMAVLDRRAARAA